MRRLPVVLLVAIVASGCTSAAVSSPSPITTAPPSFAPVSTASQPSPLASPTAAATPGCPTESPMSVATYTAADPACFGSRDVTLTGWETVPSGFGGDVSDYVTRPQWLVSYELTASVLVDQLQCETETCEPDLWVHVDPTSKLRFERNGVYVVITGHRHDPKAATCVTSWLDSPAPETALPDGPAQCADSFVLTSVREVAPPAGAFSFCPTEPVLTVFTARATECFGNRPIRVIGWLDKLPAIDFDGPSIGPDWLNLPSTTLAALWSVQPAIVDGLPSCSDAGGSSVPDCDWNLVFVNPASGLSLGKTPRWVILTGHYQDPAAETCHYTTGGFGGGDAVPPAVYARQACRTEFVVTGVQTTVAPS